MCLRLLGRFGGRGHVRHRRARAALEAARALALLNAALEAELRLKRSVARALSDDGAAASADEFAPLERLSREQPNLEAEVVVLFASARAAQGDLVRRRALEANLNKVWGNTS
eukprot:CAMPEP_0170144284 /NCGR_PEP_ID=MMETSP0033_2-20121228/13398_1 /TAXON_ID=195969 /ORGANISM="Dolichomastix tenuilepis, Strain CCMP3274" /LENGTH=112 /DNA_ID=CAMNT_0010380775 /DNA_START=116 /DNA_END=455 /DNA_ORIENTATION=+